MKELLNNCWVDDMRTFYHIFYNGNIIPVEGLPTSIHLVCYAYNNNSIRPKIHSKLIFGYPSYYINLGVKNIAINIPQN